MAYHQLTQEERYLITAQLRCGLCPAEIGRLLGRHRSTITRELRRNATCHDGDYRAEKARSLPWRGVDAVVARRASVPPRWHTSRD